MTDAPAPRLYATADRPDWQLRGGVVSASRERVAA
jgi:hypothetical protein